MAELTAEDVRLTAVYQEYALDDLYVVVGALADQYGDPALRERYAQRLPNVGARGREIVEDARSAACERRAELERVLEPHAEHIEALTWVGTLVDVVLSASVTHGVPPVAIAVALGKLANYSLKQLCA